MKKLRWGGVAEAPGTLPPSHGPEGGLFYTPVLHALFHLSGVTCC